MLFPYYLACTVAVTQATQLRSPNPERPTYPNDSLHSIQFGRVFVALQHLLQVFIPVTKKEDIILDLDF